METNNKFRILLIGTNKSFKQQIIHQIIAQKLYYYPIVEQQNDIYIFRNNQNTSLLTFPKKVVHKQEIIDFTTTKQVAIGQKIYPYFKQYHNQKNLIGVNQIGEFLIQTQIKLNIQQKILKQIQIYDLPHLYVLRSANSMDYFEDIINFDLIIIGINQKEYMEQNYGNINRNLFGKLKQQPIHFKSIKKIWIIQIESMKKINKQNISLYRKQDEFYEYKQNSGLNEYVSRQIEKIYEQKNIIEREKIKVQRVQRLSSQQKMQRVQKMQKIIAKQQKLIQKEAQINNQDKILIERQEQKILNLPLFLSDNQINGMKSDQIQKMKQLLSTDVNNLSATEYNNFLQQIGYNKRVILQDLSYIREIFCMILLILIIIWIQNEYLLLIGILIGISAVSRTNNNKIQNDKYYKQQKQRHKKVLYGEGDQQGIITHKINQLNRIKHHKYQ